ncbi:MAG: carbon storage regulator [Gammaproteobacteria bacterium]|nr:carbon storage regulator [Gammaproteobacteria bacterium]
MFHFDDNKKEVIILKTLSGLIKLDITKSVGGNINLSINAPRDVMIYREDVSVCDMMKNSLNAI